MGVEVVVIVVGNPRFTDDEVDDVKDDAQKSSNHQQYTDDFGLTMTICADLGRGLIRLTNVNWLYDSTSASHHRLLLLLRLHGGDRCLSAQTSTCTFRLKLYNKSTTNRTNVLPMLHVGLLADLPARRQSVCRQANA